jgi:hypothetical protein
VVANSRYLSYPITQDARDAMQKAFDYLQAKIPGWTPAEGNLDVWMIEAIAGEAASVGTLTSVVPKDIFQFYGETLFGIPMIDATPATGTTTWVATDLAGHTIPAGTHVGIVNSLGDTVPFEVLSDVIIPGGQSATSVGQVVILAVYPGADSSGLGTAGGAVQLMDTLAWVQAITLVAPTTGGIDGESVDDYLNRLSLELQTLSPRPILPRDFAILAQNVAGVQRAVCIDGYNPSNGSFNNERMVCIVALDANGNGVSSSVKAAIAAYLDSMREINFVVNTTDPTVTAVDVTANFTTVPGYSPSEVGSRVQSAITNYLDPRQWGIDRNDDPNNPQTWNNTTIIRYLEIATLINNVSGVDIVTLLTLAKSGQTQYAQDLTLTGVVPLPNPGTILVIGS